MIKTGDIIYYHGHSTYKVYCRCVAVTKLAGYSGTKQVWGKWSRNLEDAKKQPFIDEPNPILPGNIYNYMEIEKVFIHNQSLKQLLKEVEE